MENNSEFHIAYLKSRISKLKENLELNSEQISAYQKVLSIAENSRNYEEYLQTLGEDADLFSLARSEQIDRYRSMVSLYEKFGLEENAEVFRKKLTISTTSKSYMELATNLPQTIALPLEKISTEKINQSMILLHLLFQINTYAKRDLRFAKALQFKSEFLKLKSIDSSFSFESFFINPYLLINPFTRSQIVSLKKNLESLLGESF